MSFHKWLDLNLSKLGLITLRSYRESISSLQKKHDKELVSRGQESYGHGYAAGENDKTHTVKIKHEPINYTPSDTSIVLSTPLPITKSIIVQFEDALSKKYPPSQDQKKLIYSKNRSTKVVAGAGSGKSTTLVLRVLLLHKYLHIPLSEMTIFSFTNASCEDFREKLIETFSKHDICISKKEAKSLVRTFHSKIFQLGRATIIKSGCIPFEFLGDKEVVNEQSYLGGLNTKLTRPQISKLKKCYQLLYKNNPHFKRSVKKLYLSSLSKARKKFRNSKDLERWQIDRAQKRDFYFSSHIRNFFNIEGCSNTLAKITLSGLYRDIELYANSYVSELDLYIVFAPSEKEITSRENAGENWSESFEKGDKTLSFAWAAFQKGLMIERFCNKNVQIVTDQLDVNVLNEKISTYFKSLQAPEDVAPVFQYQLEGDIASVDIWEAFYQVSSFIENVGLEVTALKNISLPNSISRDDRLFLESLYVFWPYFDDCLGEEGIIRFHHCFSSFSEKNSENYNFLSESIIRSFTHVMIDEFQDISPEIVYWIRGMLRFLKKKDIPSSFLVVGDDDQSIYGWRGSDPQYITDFDCHFPTEENSCHVSMTDNYRSYQEIVDAGESVLSSVSYRDPTKHGSCVQGFGGKVNLIKNFDEDKVCERLSILVGEYQKISIEDRQSRIDKGENYILVLSRSNEAIQRIESRLKSILNMRHIPKCIIRFETFHRSKGLEADNCVLLDDCAYNNHFPVRNFIYSATNSFKLTYDEAQRDEAMRLAYVAITRAKVHCWWFGAPKDGGAIHYLDRHLPQAVAL